MVSYCSKPVILQSLLYHTTMQMAIPRNLPQVVVAPTDGLRQGGHVQSALPAALQAVLQEMDALAVERRTEAGTTRRGQDGEQKAV